MYIDRKIYNYDAVKENEKVSDAEKRYLDGIRAAKDTIEAAVADEEFAAGDDDSLIAEKMVAEIRKTALDDAIKLLESTEAEACASILDQYPEEE